MALRTVGIDWSSHRGDEDIFPFLDAFSGFAECDRDHDNADTKQRDGKQEKEDTQREIECVCDNHQESPSNDIFGGGYS
jgi:predicted esterase